MDFKSKLIRLISALKADSKSIVYLRGGRRKFRHETDVEHPFRQDANFFYFTGITQPNCHLLILGRDGRSILFVPKEDDHHAIWNGPSETPEMMQAKYLVDQVLFESEMKRFVKSYAPSCIHVLNDKFHPDLASFKINSSKLRDAITEMRARKTSDEIQTMRTANQIASEAHKALMGRARAGLTEFELQALFEFECKRKGCRHMSFIPTVASGKSSSILHYQSNHGSLQDGDLLLVDAGCEFQGLAADIARTYPVSGKFTEKQRQLYATVLSAQKAAIEMIRPGASWYDISGVAEQEILKGLQEAGILSPFATLDDLCASGVANTFMPHGLGHFLGCDVHDVGYPPLGSTPQPSERSAKSHDTLEQGMVMTVEPGVYFISGLLEKARRDSDLSQYIQWDVVESYRNFGGIRIEDNVLVTSTGHENLTSAPKEICDIESCVGRAPC